MIDPEVHTRGETDTIQSVLKLVMAELSSRDVVNSTQLVGEVSPSSVPGTTTHSQSNSGDGEAAVARENGIHTTPQPLGQDDQALEDGTTRSDTDTSRADGSIGDAKSTDARPLKKFATAKPVSFAKYSVPKVIAANAAKPTAEKGMLQLLLLYLYSNRRMYSSSCECATLPGTAVRSPASRRQNH